MCLRSRVIEEVQRAHQSQLSNNKWAHPSLSLENLISNLHSTSTRSYSFNSSSRSSSSHRVLLLKTQLITPKRRLNSKSKTASTFTPKRVSFTMRCPLVKSKRVLASSHFQQFQELKKTETRNSKSSSNFLNISSWSKQRSILKSQMMCLKTSKNVSDGSFLWFSSIILGEEEHHQHYVTRERLNLLAKLDSRHYEAWSFEIQSVETGAKGWSRGSWGSNHQLK